MIVSACTKLPYVVCAPETFDDEVLVFFKPEEAEARAKSLAAEKIPVSVVKLENKQLLLFYTNLYTMGVNAISLEDSGKEELIQLEDFVRRRGDEPGEEGKVWVENPALHLTALYYMPVSYTHLDQRAFDNQSRSDAQPGDFRKVIHGVMVDDLKCLKISTVT